MMVLWCRLLVLSRFVVVLIHGIRVNVNVKAFYLLCLKKHSDGFIDSGV